MKKLTEIYWTQQAKEDVRAIRAFIARDAPKTASAFVRRLRESVNRLRTFPLAGQVVAELATTSIREIFFGTYRIIYHVSSDRVEVLTIYHGSRLLDES